MQDNKIRSRLKAQLTKFTTQLSEGLSKPLEKFVGEMLFGIQARQDVKLSNVAGSLEEDIPLIKTEDRLLRNLRRKSWRIISARAWPAWRVGTWKRTRCCV